jgi:hypothetical protein
MANKLRSVLRRPSPAAVLAAIALFAALDGPAAALRGVNTVFRDDIARNAVGRSEIVKNGVGKSEAAADSIGKSELREEGDRDGGLTGAYIVEGTLGTVPNAQALQGRGPASFAPANRENIRSIGTPGNPSFQGNWGVYGGEERPGFLKDPYRVVHLYGQAIRSSGTATVIFTLPPGYRPSEDLFFPAYGVSGGAFTPAFIDVEPNGNVGTFGPDVSYVGLSSVSFPIRP